MWLRRHPSHQTLSLYVDEELTEGRRNRVVQHLAGCAKCRREVDFMFEAQRGLREITKPRPPRDLLSHILARREAGERIILPTAWASPRRFRPAIPAVAGAVLAVLAAAVAVLILSNGEAAAGASGMEFSPSTLDRTQEIEVEYNTVGALAAEPKLLLRGRYLTADDEMRLGKGGTYFSTELWPEDDGAFRGLVRLPGSAVYAQFAVEDGEGEYVDHNGYRSWELMAEYENGRPRFEALWQRAQVFQGRYPQEAYSSLKRLTELYPDRVEGWSTRYSYEESAVATTPSEGFERLHAAKFDGFSRRAVTGSPSASELGELVNYARRLHDRPAQELWTDALRRLHPNDPIAVRERVQQLYESHQGEPKALLIEFERVWERVGPIQPLLLQRAYTAAREAQDESAIRLWTTRLVSTDPTQVRVVAWQLERIPSLRAFAADLIRGELRRLEKVSGVDRPIHLSISEYRAENRRRRHDLLATLGRILAAEDRVDAGIDTMLLAADLGWDPELFAELAELIGARGDGATALRFRALAAVDPLAPKESLTPPHDVDYVTSSSSWRNALETAQQEQRTRVYATQVDRRVIGEDIVIRDPREVDRPLDTLLGEVATIVFLWSRWAHQETIDISQRLLEVRDQLESSGISILAVTRDPDAERALQDWREAGVELPVYSDPQGRATAGLQSLETPDLLVLDADGVIRFAPVDVDEAARAALTLYRDR